MDTKKKFLEVLDGVDFRYRAAVDSPEQLMKFGQHVLAQYESLGEERQQRAYDLMCVILADALQPRALAKYNDAGFDSIRRLLVEEFSRLGADSKWRKYIELAKRGIAKVGLTDFQLEQLNKQFDLMPDILVEFLARMASRFDLLPRKNTAILTLILRDMFQEEANHAESKRHN